MSDANAHPETGALTTDNAAALIANLHSEPDAPSESTEPAQEAETQDQVVETESAGEVESQDEAVEYEAEAEESAEEVEIEEVDSSPSLAAPVSWSAEEKAEFADLPENVQRVVAGREAERDRAFQTKTTELGERNKQLDEAVKIAEQQSLGQMQQAQALMAQAFEAAGFTQEPNWAEVRATYDREDYQDMRDAWDDSQRRLGKFQQDYGQMQQHATQQQQQKYAEYVSAENSKTADRWPEFANTETKATAVEGLLGYLETQGVPRSQTIHLVDANMISIVRKAMELDALKANNPKVKKKVKSAPKMAKPGSPKTKSRAKVENVRDALKNAAGSHNARDIAGVFAALRS